MAGRYLLVAGSDAGRQAAITARLAPGFRTAIDQPGLLLLVSAGLPVLPLGDRGAVLGTLFVPGQEGPLASLAPPAIEAILASGGRHLVDRYWGGYVAVLPSQPDAAVLLRAPFGWLPCLYTAQDSIMAAASDVATLTAAGLFAPQLNPAALGRHLLAPDIRREETVLKGLTELRGGDRLSLAPPGYPRETLWSPWDWVTEERMLADPDEAARRLRDTALYCVRERAGPAPTLLLMSGGLDSSIVAASLHAEGRSTTGLTFVTDNPSGDEREPSALVASHLTMPLCDDRCRVEHVDLTRSAAAHLPRPVARAFEQGTHILMARAVDATGATRILDGGGGDNVFCSIQSPAPVADCLMTPRGRGHFWSTARSVAELAEASVWTVARRGWQRASDRRPYRRAADTSFLSAVVAADADMAAAHPWLDAPPGVLPGRSVHVGLLAPAQGLIESHDPSAVLTPHPVLVSQPLIETCLRIPSWLWFDHGHNRATARHAFADRLPSATAWRRSKGSPDSYLVQILDANRPLVRTLLTDGLLASLGLIDPGAVAAALDDPRPMRGHGFARLMQLVDAEVWGRVWRL